MRAARDHHQPLSVFRGDRAPGKRWTWRDRALALGLRAYEDDACTGCGQPRTYSMDEDARGRYAAHTSVCHSCAAIDKAEHVDKNPKPGVRRYTTPDAGLEHAMTHPVHVSPFDL